ncbi:MAG: hypothetical protein M1820_000991 [Bogoriella megaspora]|nr:MAG: hypothetical protein M1820_000991 [Bogoriella megaspora]
MASTAEPANVSEQLLKRAHSPETASQIYEEKVHHRPLLLRPTSSQPDNARDARQKARLAKQALRRRSKKPRPLSAKEKRALCVYDVPKSQQKYDIYVPLNKMWISYMQDVLGLGKQRGDGSAIMGVTPRSAGAVLVSADFHGAELEVVRSRCISRVGVRGIVIKDTKYTFEIVTRSNEMKILPKEHTIFRFEVPLPVLEVPGTEAQVKRQPLVFELHGSRFETSAPARAKKNVKLHLDPDL